MLTSKLDTPIVLGDGIYTALLIRPRLGDARYEYYSLDKQTPDGLTINISMAQSKQKILERFDKVISDYISEPDIEYTD